MIDLSSMFSKIGDGFAALGQRIRSVFGRQALAVKTYTLRGELESLVRNENLRAALQGLDKNDVPLIDVKRRSDPERVEREGWGPPLAPHFSGSRIVTMFNVSIQDGGEEGFVIEGTWPGVGFLKYHADTGAPRTIMPIRDIVGIRPSTRLKINDLTQRWVEDIHL